MEAYSDSPYSEPYSENPSLEPEGRLIRCRHNCEVFVVSANEQNVEGDDLRTLGELPVPGTAANTACIVLCVRFARRQVLICGDATFSTEHRILNSAWAGKPLESYALAGGHHGSAYSFSERFLQAVNPSWVHFSADNKGTFRHPTWEAVDRIMRCCPGVVQSEYGPHGIVIGPKKKTGKAMEESGGEFIPLPRRLTGVFYYMLKNGVGGEAALQALLPKWSKDGEWPLPDLTPRTPIKEQWVSEILYAWHTNNNGLVHYWGKEFDKFVDEIRRLDSEKKVITDYKYYWDWSIVDFNLFTTLTTANVGVYWELTIDQYGECYTNLG